MIVTILAPPTAAALTTLANVRMDLGSAAAIASDFQIERFIAQASCSIAGPDGGIVGVHTVRQQFAAIGRELDDEDGAVRLARSPVSRILAVTADGQPLDSSAFEHEGRMVYSIANGDRQRWYADNVTVDYEAGYLLPGQERGNSAAPHLPATIEANCIALVGQRIHALGRDPMVVSESVDGVGSTIWEGNDTSSVQRSEPASSNIPESDQRDGE